MSTQAAYHQAAFSDYTQWSNTETTEGAVLERPTVLERAIGVERIGVERIGVEAIQVSSDDSHEIGQALVDLLGVGVGPCLELGCPPNARFTALADLGWSPVTMDLSTQSVQRGRGGSSITKADGGRLPIASNSLRAVAAVMVHSNSEHLPNVDYSEVLAEAFRVLRPGGVFVHVDLHPCYNGDSGDQAEADSITIGPGHLENGLAQGAWAQGSQPRAGIAHLPLSSLLNTVAATGLTIDRFSESGRPAPQLLSFRATKPAAPFIG